MFPDPQLASARPPRQHRGSPAALSGDKLEEIFGTRATPWELHQCKPCLGNNLYTKICSAHNDCKVCISMTKFCIWYRVKYCVVYDMCVKPNLIYWYSFSFVFPPQHTYHKNIRFCPNWVGIQQFTLKIGPNASHGRSGAIRATPGAKTCTWANPPQAGPPRTLRVSRI